MNYEKIKKLRKNRTINLGLTSSVAALAIVTGCSQSNSTATNSPSNSPTPAITQSESTPKSGAVAVNPKSNVAPPSTSSPGTKQGTGELPTSVPPGMATTPPKLPTKANGQSAASIVKKPVTAKGPDPALGGAGSGDKFGASFLIPDVNGQDGWGPCKLSAITLAHKADATLGSLKNAYSDARIHFDSPAGHGDAKVISKFSSVSRYAVQFCVFDNNAPRMLTAIANGTHREIIRNNIFKGETKQVSESSLNQSSGLGPDPISTWLVAMPKYVLGHFEYGQNVYTTLVNAINKPNSGYLCATQSRTVTYNNKVITSYRIIAERNPKETLEKGYSQIEIVLDGERFLPLTLRTRTAPANRKTESSLTEWTSRWVPQTYKDSEFAIEK